MSENNAAKLGSPIHSSNYWRSLQELANTDEYRAQVENEFPAGIDAPTDGLDPNQKHEVRLMIREMSASKAIIFSTHILDEVDSVCSRAMIIAGGKVVADDTPDGLRERSSFHGSVVLGLKGTGTAEVQQRIENLGGVASVSVVNSDGGETTLRVFPEDSLVPIADRVIALVGQEKVGIASVFVEQGRLDHVFRDIMAREQLMSTGIGDGIAIPHGKTSGIPEVLCAFGVKPGGVDFKSIDGMPADIFFLIVSPEDDQAIHLKFLATISHLLQNEENRQHIREFSSSQDAMAFFTMIDETESPTQAV